MSTKRQDYISWDEYFMGVAMLSGMRSKDPNTQVGACIVSAEHKILSMGYNGFPAGCSDDEFPWVREGEDNKYFSYQRRGAERDSQLPGREPRGGIHLCDAFCRVMNVPRQSSSAASVRWCTTVISMPIPPACWHRKRCSGQPGLRCAGTSIPDGKSN